MDLTLLKVILVIIMAALTFLAGSFPVRLLKILRKRAASAATLTKQRILSLILCLLTCFSGGVFLATCFLHLFPELSEHWNMMKDAYTIRVSYPIAELLSCSGFFLLFFLEEVVLYFLPGIGHSHEISNANLNHDHGGHINAHEADHCCHETFYVNTRDTLDSSVDSDYNHLKKESSAEKVLLGKADGNRRSRKTVPCNSNPRECHSESECCNYDSPRILKHSVVPIHYGSLSSLDVIARKRRPALSAALTLAEPEACETNCDNVKEDPPILMKSSPHAHSHGVRSITFVLAISFHSIIEGLALGVQKDAAEVTALFISLMVHKSIVAFSVGLQLARTHAHSLGWVYASIMIFAAMSPLGSIIGMFVQNSSIEAEAKDIMILVFQGLAVGTFIYVTFFEVLIHERDNEHPNLLKLLFILIGFALIGSLRLFDDHSHEAGESHLHEQYVTSEKLTVPSVMPHQ
ncbi:hypothetical protein AB6A40_005082 [Gnathostoma spinigerum]|uniref:Uncharacterized protein n=1 Tax=Gnathostoma spinigerum TaxID=75299 RepID=A0ABD6EN27_9BILA